MSIMFWKKIVVPPMLRLPARNHLAVLGRNLPLFCTAMGVPLPTVRWEKRQDYISASDKHYLRYFTDGNVTVTLVLWVMRVAQTDLGDYTCIASNRMGTSRSIITLYGIEELSPEPDCIDVLTYDESSLGAGHGTATTIPILLVSVLSWFTV